jgi:mRNA interferase MazF
VYLARLDPTALEHAGRPPVVVVTRDAINQNSPVLVVVPLTARTNKSRIYPSHVVVQAGEGGLAVESVALSEQVRAISKPRLMQYLGRLGPGRLSALNDALKITLDLP